jgi:hypothetical protein
VPNDCKAGVASAVRGPEHEYRKMNRKIWRLIIEVAFIMFLFYANLLMGEFERANSAGGKDFAFALTDIFTMTNFAIGMFASLIGYAVVEFLRGKF